MTELSKDDKARLGVLWVLLNVSTEYEYDSKVICDIMDAIEKRCPDAPKMWDKKFTLSVNGKIVYDQN